VIFEWSISYGHTLFSKVRNIKGNTCANVITNGNFTEVFPILERTLKTMAQTLNDFMDDVGISDTCL
jgi:hypothetical protein